MGSTPSTPGLSYVRLWGCTITHLLWTVWTSRSDKPGYELTHRIYCNDYDGRISSGAFEPILGPSTCVLCLAKQGKVGQIGPL